MLRLIVGLVLIAHGIGHAMGFLASWTSIPSGLSSGHWVVSNDVVMDSTIGRVFGLAWLLALLMAVAAGVGLLLHQEWWQPLAVTSAVVSLASILPWINVMPVFSAAGAALVDIAILVVLLTHWGDSALEQIG